MSNNKQAIDYEKLVANALESIEARTGWMRRQTMIALGVAAILVGLMCATLMAEGLAAVQAGQATLTPSPTATLVALPTSEAQTVLAKLKQAGIVPKDTKTLAVPNSDWRATQAIQFTMLQADKHGAFFVLSYDTIQNAELDAFAVSNNPKWKGWHMVQLVNLLILGDPDNDAGLEISVEQQLTQLLIDSYRSTPLPMAT